MDKKELDSNIELVNQVMYESGVWSHKLQAWSKIKEELNKLIKENRTCYECKLNDNIRLEERPENNWIQREDKS